jgi:hypothetical protein
MSGLPNGSAPTPPVATQQLQLNGAQLATMLTIERLAQDMQTCVNQLGGFVGYPAGADVILHAMNKLMRDYQTLKEQWGRHVQLASPEVVKSVIAGKG